MDSLHTLDNWIKSDDGARKYSWDINNNSNTSALRIFNQVTNDLEAVDQNEMERLLKPFTPMVTSITIGFPLDRYYDNDPDEQVLRVDSGIRPIDLIAAVAQYYRERPAVLDALAGLMFFEGFNKFIDPVKGTVYDLSLGS